MKRKLLASILISSQLLASSALAFDDAASYQKEPEIKWQKEDYKNYLAKLINQSSSEKLYDFNELNYDAAISKWLEDLDAELNRLNLPSLNADFEFTLNRRGNVISLQILELREDKPQVFRDFSSAFLSFKAPALPESIPENTKFKINARWSYVDRANDLELSDDAFSLSASKADIAFSDYDAKLEFPDSPASPKASQLENLLVSMANEKNFALTLIEPRYIDFPRVGEKIVFRVDDGLEKPAIFQGRIIKTGKRDMEILTSKIKFLDGSTATKDLLWRAEAKMLDKGANLRASMTSGAMTWLAMVDISTAISTKGIAPGAAIVLGMVSGWRKENDKVHSFNLKRNDTILVKKGDK